MAQQPATSWASASFTLNFAEGQDIFILSLFQEGNTTEVRLVFKGDEVQVNIRNSSDGQTVSGKLKAASPTPLSSGVTPQVAEVKIRVGKGVKH